MKSTWNPFKGVHFCTIFNSSMGMHLSGSACGDFTRDTGPDWLQHFESTEKAMQLQPGAFGWWSDKVEHVDCPGCLETLKREKAGG